MYAAFAFSGACDLLLAQPLARIIGFASLAQAFAVELLLFWCDFCVVHAIQTLH